MFVHISGTDRALKKYWWIANFVFGAYALILLMPLESFHKSSKLQFHEDSLLLADTCYLMNKFLASEHYLLILI